jgi:hypothetical protein
MLLLVGCGEDESVDVAEQISILTPPPSVKSVSKVVSKNVSACYDVIEWTTSKVKRCVDDNAGAKLEKDLLEKWDCENINSVRDIEKLYSGCKTGIILLSCNSFLFGTIPEDCYYQLVFDK